MRFDRTVSVLFTGTLLSLIVGCGGASRPPERSTDEEAAKKELKKLEDMRQKESQPK